MNILIIRHGEPDYANDSITERGADDARRLAAIIDRFHIDEFYVSPLGRARATIQPSLDRLGVHAEVLPWLREFSVPIRRPDKPDSPIPWDWMPADWTAQEDFFDEYKWSSVPVMRDAGVPERLRFVTEHLDAFLADHGYVREGRNYKAVSPNHKTVAFFCHFGLESILLGHLLHLPVMPLWHGTCALTTSVTKVTTEERQDGTACFRMLYFGALPHLWEAGIEPAFAARYVECFEDEGRH